MREFIFKVIIYLLCFVISFYGLSALDFKKIIKQGKVTETWVLYFIIAASMAYLFGSFLMEIIYRFS